MVDTLPTLDILIATYAGNYNHVEQNLPAILHACQNKLKGVRWRIVIAHNGNDSNLSKMVELSKKFEHVAVSAVKKPGKGNAILNNIRSSTADLVMYMDADLATDLNVLPALVDAVQHADMVSGSRYHAQSNIYRNWIRLFVSSVYTRLILRGFLNVHFTDPQCGFKAFNRARIAPIIEDVQDSWFFFETELTYKAERRGLKIVEIPVTWREQPNSSVKLVPTIINFLQNLWRVRTQKTVVRPPAWGEEVKMIHSAAYSKWSKTKTKKSANNAGK